MGSLDRKVRRNQERARYEKFGEDWFRAKRAGQKVNGKELGRKPGFAEFKRRMKLHEAVMKLEEQNKAKEKELAEKKLDLEWKDE